MSSFDTPRQSANGALGRKITETLVANGYKTAQYVETASEALAAAASRIPDGASVGVPGTVTIRDIGLMEKLSDKKCRVFHHWDPKLTPKTRVKRLHDENTADWFVTSSNALTVDGKMVNIDGTGNRVAAMAWGTGKILYIIGINKVERDLERAIARARNTATPANTIRIGMTTPCVKLGYCVDCNAPERSCRAVLIMERVPFGREAHVILVGESLGY
jgi:NADPH:quinone reductase-like Zn-dependent oxidoreductase